MTFCHLVKQVSSARTMSCSGDTAGSGGNSCFGGRTTVGMIRLWRDVSSSVASSRIWAYKGFGREGRDQKNEHVTESLVDIAIVVFLSLAIIMHLGRYRATYPACSLKHFEVQWVSRQLALYFGERVAGGHASHKLGLDQILLVGIFLWQVETGDAGQTDDEHAQKKVLLCENYQ